MAQPQLIICVQKQGFRSSEILSSKTRTAESEHAACCVPGHRPSVTGTRCLNYVFFLMRKFSYMGEEWRSFPHWAAKNRVHTKSLGGDAACN